MTSVPNNLIERNSSNTERRQAALVRKAYKATDLTWGDSKKMPRNLENPVIHITIQGLEDSGGKVCEKRKNHPEMGREQYTPRLPEEHPGHISTAVTVLVFPFVGSVI